MFGNIKTTMESLNGILGSTVPIRFAGHRLHRSAPTITWIESLDNHVNAESRTLIKPISCCT